MRKLHLSIFSSETLRLEGLRPAEALRVLLLSLLFLLAAEAGTRYLLRNTGNAWLYWSDAAAIKFEHYRTLSASEQSPQILIIGDSTAARDLSPAAMEEVLGNSHTVYNLASPANFPIAYRCTTLPLLENAAYPPKIVVMQFSPASFLDLDDVIRFEQAILTSPLCKQWSGERLVGDFLYLGRFWRVFNFRSAWNQWWRGQPIPQQPLNAGFMPMDTLSKDMKEQPIYQTTVTLAPQRIQVIIESAELIQKQGGKLIVVIPPFYGHYNQHTSDAYLTTLQDLAKSYPLIVIDGRDLPELGVEAHADYVHLNESGAIVFSQFLAKQIAPYLTTTP